MVYAALGESYAELHLEDYEPILSEQMQIISEAQKERHGMKCVFSMKMEL